MKITRIKDDKYKVGKHTLTLTEFHQLKLEVAMGVKPHGIVVTNIATGQSCRITENGGLTDNIIRDAKSTILGMLLRFNREVVRK